MRHTVIIKEIIGQTILLMQVCNEDTISMPIQALAYFSQIDPEARELASSSEGFFGRISTAFEAYHGDSMIADDLVLLLKVYVDCEGFRTVFLPLIANTFKQVVDCLQNAGDAKKQ